MAGPDVDEFVARAEAIYTDRLQSILERDHLNQFVAIEPQSGDHFLGATLNDASRSARQVYPDRLTHVIRIGHRAALHFGLHVR